MDKNKLFAWLTKISNHNPIKITSEDFRRSILSLGNNPDWRIIGFNCNDFDFDSDGIKVIHMETDNGKKTFFVYLRMCGPQIDGWQNINDLEQTCADYLVIQFDIDESATPYTGKIENYFVGIKKTIIAPK